MRATAYRWTAPCPTPVALRRAPPMSCPGMCASLSGRAMFVTAAGRSGVPGSAAPAMDADSLSVDGLWRSATAHSSARRGVSRHSDTARAKVWEAYVWVDDRNEHIGCFATEAEASAAYEGRCAELSRDPNPTLTSEFLGVSWDKTNGKWRAKIRVGAVGVQLKSFAESDEAAAAAVYAGARAARDGLREAGMPDAKIGQCLKKDVKGLKWREKLIARCRREEVVLSQNEQGRWSHTWSWK